MVNSIKDKLGKEDTISDVKMMLYHNKTNICVVVEGEDDVILFSQLLGKQCVIYQSYSSKIGVDEIVHDFFKNNHRVVGIRDRDYQTCPCCNQVFFCDYCCAEMMMIANDDCFDRLYLNFYKKGAYDSDALRLYCLQCLEYLSQYRKLNEENNWRVRFNGVSPGDLYHIDASIMNKNILRRINQISNDNIIDDARASKHELCKSCLSLEDYLEITNGHDFLSLFHKLCSSHNNSSIDSMSKFLRGTFGKTEFKGTSLYKNLVDYKETYGIQFFD